MSLASLTDQRIRMAQSMADRAVDPTQIRALLARLTEQVRTGVLPPYGGIPIIQTLTQKLSQMQNAQGTAQARQNAQRPPIAQEVMQQAQGAEGVAGLPTNLPAEGMAGGGIVAFEEGGEVERYQNKGYTGNPYNVSFEQLMPYEPTSYGTVDRALLNMFRTPGAVRIDPVTNEPITFAEFQRRRESSLAQTASPVAQAMVPAALAAAPAAAAVAPTATPAATPPASSQADRLRGDAIDSRPAAPAAFTPFTLGDINLPSGDRPNVRLPKITLPTMPAATDYRGIVSDLPTKAKEAFTEARDKEETALRAMTEPGESAREARFQAREATLGRDAAINRALSIMSAGLGIAGSKERTLAGALGREGREGIQALIQSEAASRVAKERLEDARDNFEQQKIAAKKGDRTAANAAGQRAADDLRAYRSLELQAATAKGGEDLQRYTAQQAGVLGQAGLEQSGALGMAGLEMQGRQLAQAGALGIAGLNLQGAQLNNQMLYQNRLLDLNERRINAADAATKAKYAQVKVNALKQFDAGEGAQIARMLTKQYGPQWRIGNDVNSQTANMIYEQRRQAYLLGALDQADLLRETGGARNAESLLGSGQ